MSEQPEALLINPPIYDFALYDLYLKPYGLLMLGSMLKAAGWKVRVLNALDYRDDETIKQFGQVKRLADGTGKFHRQIQPQPPDLKGIRRHFARYGIIEESFASAAAESRPDAVFITSGMTYWYRGVVESVEMCRRLFSSVPVIAGGVYSSLMPDHCAVSCGPDFIASGSLTVKDSSGTGLSSEGRRLGSFLNGLGLPGVRVPAEDSPIDEDCWDDAAVLRLNSGCPMSCSYCASKKLCNGFHAGSPDSAFNFMRSVNERRGTVNFAFYDDALLYSSDDVFLPFLRMVVDYSRKTGKRFNFFTPNAMHIRYMTPETAVLMRQAGFREIRLGFESSSADFHDEYDSKYSEHGFFQTVKMLTDAGFSRNEIVVYILAGLPGQTAAEVEDTIRFAGSGEFTLSVSEFSPVPGSPMWSRCVDECRFPIAEEPLFHNNSFFPMEWSGFTYADMQRLKMLSKEIPKGRRA